MLLTANDNSYTIKSTALALQTQSSESNKRLKVLYVQLASHAAGLGAKDFCSMNDIHYITDENNTNER